MKRRSIVIIMAIILFCALVLAVTRFPILRISTPLPTKQIALLSYHQQYVVAKDEGDDWAIRQEPVSEPCVYFTMRRTWNGKVVLESCHGHFVTAPESGQYREDWILRQETKPGKCGEFDMYELGNNRVAFKTCTGNFLTAGDNGLGWDDKLEWAIVGETNILDDWEIFILEEK